MIKRKVTGKGKNFLGIYLFELFSDGLTGSEDIDFYLFLRDGKDSGNILVTFPLDVSQLHTTALFLWQLVDEIGRAHV